MRISFGDFLSRILVKARSRNRFFGVVLGRVAIGVIVPAAAPAPEFPLPDLPGMS